MTKTVNVYLFIFLTLLNMGVGLYLTDYQVVIDLIVVFVCFVLNQFMLVDGALHLIRDDGNKKRALIFLPSKIFILIFAFWYAMQNSEKYLYIFIGNYIFQLIILGLSIKNDTKKIIKDSI